MTDNKTDLEIIEEGFDRFHILLPQLLERFPDITGNESRIFQEALSGAGQDKMITVAVTGKIKQGKSTLINSLIDRDLPTTGITEATGTINRIKHINQSDNGDLNGFVVKWRDENREDTRHQLDELRHYIGEECKDKQHEIKHLTMYAEADFLQNVTLVDTPGEQGTQLSEIHIEPDALIRAIPFDVEANDDQKLKQYAEETRAFGSWPFNTIAVTQKWEQHWPANSENPFEQSPLDPANERARWQMELLKDSVAKIIPVSGLLWFFSKNVTDELLTKLLAFVRSSHTEELESFIKSERRYLNKEVESSTKELRKSLLDEVKDRLGNHGESAAWPVLKMVIWACVFHDTPVASSLRNELRRLSNMDELTQTLEAMFFKRSRLLKMQTILNKTISIAQEADYKLNTHRCYLEGYIDDADKVLAEVEMLLANSGLPASITKNYLQSSKKNLMSERSRLEEVIRQIQKITIEANRQLHFLTEDTGWLERIEGSSELKTTLKNNNELEEVRSLFGHYGAAAYQRLGFDAPEEKQVLEKKLFELLSYWKGRRYASLDKEYNELVEHVIERLNELHKAVTKTS